MRTQAGTREAKGSRSIAAALSPKPSENASVIHPGDYRVQAVRQQELQALADSGPAAGRAAQFHIRDHRPPGRGSPPAKIAYSRLDGIVQRVPFNNVEAKFRTDNEDPDIANSEYHVTTSGYERYAPINKYRKPSEFFHEGERTFMYFETANADKFYRYLKKYYWKASKDDGTVSFKYWKTDRWKPMPADTRARLAPANGLEVFDCKLDDDGEISGDTHFGHPVEDLGKALPELDQADKLQELRILQRWMDYIIETSQLGQGKFTEAELLAAWEKRGKSPQDEKKYREYKDNMMSLFAALEFELIHNWAFWTK